MKIHQLPMGARFEYEGEEYVKTGPMFATSKLGQRMIPKYAVLKPSGADVPAGRAPREQLPRAEVLKASTTSMRCARTWFRTIAGKRWSMPAMPS